MIRVETDSIGSGRADIRVDFKPLLKETSDLNDFTRKVEFEMKASVLAVISATQDAYCQMLSQKISDELLESVKEHLLLQIQNIKQENVDEFLENMLGIAL